MNDMEQLVRDALHDAPSVPTHVTDPVGLVARRARRVRLMLGSGVVAVGLVVTAAVVVPMELGGTSTQRVQITHQPTPSASESPTATPSPSPSPAPGQPVSWGPARVSQVTASDGWIWALEPNPSSNSGAMYVDKVDPRTHESIQKWDVQAPATWIAVASGYVWVWGGGDGAYPDGVVQAIDTTRQDKVVAYTLKGQGFGGLVPIPDGAHDVAVLAGDRVLQLVASSDGLTQVASMSIDQPVESNLNVMAATGAGDIWVRTKTHLVELDFPGHSRPYGSPAIMASQPKDTVAFAGLIYGPAGKDALWAYDGDRLIALSPAALHTGVSVAEGARIALFGAPQAVVPDGRGGLFVAVGSSADMGNGTSTGVSDGFVGLVAVPAATARDGGSFQTSWPHLAGVTPLGTLAPDAAGGVNYVNNDGGASYWRPSS